MINLSEKEEFIINLGYELFNKITAIDPELRKDEKPRTGIQILLRDIIESRNLCMVSIGKPSFYAQYLACEKSNRTEWYKHFSSQNSQNPEKGKFRGCVAIKMFDKIYHASVSGLQADEDVTIAIILLSRVFGIHIDEVMESIQSNGGALPKALSDKSHYLYKFMEQYK